MQPNKERFLHRRVCERIVAKAQEKGLLKTQIVAATQVSEKTVFEVYGLRARLQERMIHKFAAALGTSFQFLTTGKEVVESSGTRLKESAFFLGERDSGEVPDRLHQAIKIVAEQMGLPEPEILDALCEMAKKKLAETKSESA